MKTIQNIVQSKNNKALSRGVLLSGSAVFVLFFVYIFLLFQTTAVAYEIKTQQQEQSEYLIAVAELENDYHQQKLTLSVANAYERGFDKMGSPQFVSVREEVYTLAR